MSRPKRKDNRPRNPKVHYPTPGDPVKHGLALPLCGLVITVRNTDVQVVRFDATTNRSKVTCKRCKRCLLWD